ncbi:MAG: protoheme IX farnesyltransferase [Chloroflexi bacterium]|nr:protoheme IX farnesyltransferase [Chloroflexota bacterium]
MGTLETGLRHPALTWRETASAYVSLTKPRIISLLLITTIPTMVLANKGVPSLWLMFATLVGGTLAAGGANAINCYLDRDIDEIMHRTQGRPLPLGKMEPLSAIVFGLTLELVAFALLAGSSNLLAACLALSATLFYVFVYTMMLKRTTPQNIVIGGAAGAVPPLVAWAAVTGTIGAPAVILFAVICFWTPPHFWALAIKYKDDYARAGVPMLPVVATLASTKRQIFAYSVLLLPVSLSLLVTGTVGWVYAACALVLGGLFVWEAWRLRANDAPGTAMGVFRASIYYLAFIFIAVAADQMILG